jgi:osmoprotectant transport system substrate-binding protein
VPGFQNLGPSAKSAGVTAAGSEFTKTVNAVSAKLTLPAILAMNKAVIIDKKDPAAVAKQFLQANGLLT